MCCSLSPKSLRCSNGFFTVLAIIVSVVILVLSVLSAVNYTSGFVFVEYAINWNNEVIIDVAQVDAKTGTCTQNNLPALSYQFNGLSTGCDCTKSGGTVTTGSCSSSKSATCSTVKSIAKTTMQNWVDANGNPLRLCFTRLPNYKFSKKYLKENKCRDPANEKMCGGSDPMIAFCVPNSQKCPVQSITTSKMNPSDEPIGTTGLWLQRGIAGQIGLSELYISEQQGMCVDSLSSYWDGLQKPYPLLKEYYYSNCKIDTVYWKKVQDLSKADFFKVNGYDPTTFPGLVGNSQVSLQQRKYLPWSKECRQQDSLITDLIDIAINYINDYNNHTLLYKVSIGNVSFLGVYCVLLFLGCFTTQIDRKCCAFRGCCKTSLCCCPCLKDGCTLTICTLRSPECIRKWWTKKDVEDQCTDYCRLIDPIHLILIIVKFGFDLALLGLAVMNFVKVKSYKNTFSDISNMNCSTSDFKDSLQTTNDNLKNIVTPLDTVVLAIVVVYVCASFLCIFTYICNQISKRREIIKKKCQFKQVKVIEENDQTIPTILTQQNAVSSGEIPLNNNLSQTIQMQQNPYPPQQQNPPYPPNQFTPQQVNQPYQATPYNYNQPLNQPPVMVQPNYQQAPAYPQQIVQPVYYQQPQNYPAQKLY